MGKWKVKKRTLKWGSPRMVVHDVMDGARVVFSFPEYSRDQAVKVKDAHNRILAKSDAAKKVAAKKAAPKKKAAKRK